MRYYWDNQTLYSDIQHVRSSSEFEDLKINCLPPLLYQFGMGLSTRQSVGCLILKKEMAGWVQQKVTVLVWLILPLISSFSEQRSSCFRWWLHLQPLAAVAMNTRGRRGVTMLHVTFRPCPFIGDLFFSAFFPLFSAVFSSFSHDCKQASKGASKQGRRKERVVLVVTTFAFCQTLWEVCHFYFFFGVLVVGPGLPWCCDPLVLWYFGGSSGGSNAAVVMAVGVAVLVMIIVALEGEVEV